MNLLPVLEVRNYRRVVLEGVVIVTYEQRQPGATDWQPVRIVRLT